MDVRTRQGVEGFRAELADFGVESSVADGLVCFELEILDGPSAGGVIQIGIDQGELIGWPATPPHWIHLPSSVQFSSTNMEASGSRDGWSRHSREIGTWGGSESPGQPWLAHARAVLCEVIAYE